MAHGDIAVVAAEEHLIALRYDAPVLADAGVHRRLASAGADGHGRCRAQILLQLLRRTACVCILPRFRSGRANQLVASSRLQITDAWDDAVSVTTSDGETLSLVSHRNLISNPEDIIDYFYRLNGIR